MKRLLLLCSLLLAPSLAAHADTFSFSYGSTFGPSGTGTLTATKQGNGSFLVTGITSSTGDAITGLLSPGTYKSNDNLLTPASSTLLDLSGIAFSLTGTLGNSYNVSFVGNSNGTYTEYATNGLFGATNTYNQGTAFSATNTTPVTPAAVTPEPSTLVLLGTGLILLSVAAMRKGSVSSETAMSAAI